jgi:NTF2 fold immunity protein
MKACAFVIILTVSATGILAHSQTSPVPAVPDEAAAVKVAEKALAKIYGRKQIQSERPFTAKLSDGIWHITGTLYCKDRQGNVIKDACLGGVALADIRQNDGRVLKTGHTQ